jgi:hypothetical protein
MIEVYVEDLGEEAYGIVYLDDDGLYSIYDIPLYGGEERFYKQVATLEEAIKITKTEFT